MMLEIIVTSSILASMADPHGMINLHSELFASSGSIREDVELASGLLRTARSKV